MDFLGVGPLELVFILLIALLVLGPREIASFARRAGQFMNRLYRSELWGTISRASQEFRNLPNRLAREAALDDLDRSIRGEPQGQTPGQSTGDGMAAWRPSPKSAASDKKPDQDDGGPPEAEASDEPTDS